MSLGSCEKCWEDPCMCGHDYENMPTDRLLITRDSINRVLSKRLDTSQAVQLTLADLSKSAVEARREVIEEILVHSSRTGLNVVIDQNVLRSIENRICPNSGSHE